ncbi:MAG: DUF5677 domain-containing protein [Armatimonadota bacterium]
MVLSEQATQLLDAFLTVCDKLIERTNQLPPPTDEVDRRVKHRYYFYLNKSISTFMAFNILIRKGYLYEAQIISRANFELLVDLIYYHSNPIHLSQRFDDYFHVASEYEVLLLNVGCDETKLPAAEKSRIDALKESFRSKYGGKKFPKHWSGINTIRERSINVGMEESYRTTYHLRSDIAHSGINSEACYMHFVNLPLENTMDVLRQQKLCIEIVSACTDMLHCLKIAEDGLALMSYELIHDLYNQYASYAGTILGIIDR